jgi:hypothetical protein
MLPILALVFSLLIDSGCGKSGKPETIPIKGQVTLDGGPWPKEGEVFFLPLQPSSGYPRRAAVAIFTPEGAFDSPTSWVSGDGVVPGLYKVYVTCWKVPPTRSGPPPVSYTDDKYISGATSDIEVEITAESEDEEFHWDFPSKKR